LKSELRSQGSCRRFKPGAEGLRGSVERDALSKFEDATAYFARFRETRLQDYVEAMREYRIGPNTGYDRFPGSDFVIDTVRNVVGALEEYYANLKVPDGWVTEEKLVESWRYFLGQLDNWGDRFETLRPGIIAAGKAKVMGDPANFEDHEFLPAPFTAIDQIRAEVRDAVSHALAIVDSGQGSATGNTVDLRLAQIFGRFRKVAIQLTRRHADRPTLVIGDEYDVQDLMHAMLKIEFDDIRPEDYSPSYAGGNSRIDFLLPNEQVAVEIKMTRPTLRDKQLGEELIIDVARYGAQANVSTLHCFVYDPGAHIVNPDGLKKDLEKLGNGVRVIVTIVPHH
jgi:hypothetical protein